MIAQDAEDAVKELCRGADPAARGKAGELFEALVLPALEAAVNEDAEYADLRAAFLWRVVAEWHRSEGGDALAKQLASLDSARWRRDGGDGWKPAHVFDRYSKSAAAGEFFVKREVEGAGGAVLRRTYFHGGVDFRRVHFCARTPLGQTCGGDEGAPLEELRSTGLSVAGVGLIASSSSETL